MRRMVATIPREKLESQPKWQTLVSLHSSLKKLLPNEYREKYPPADWELPPTDGAVMRRKRNADFNGELAEGQWELPWANERAHGFICFGYYKSLRTLRGKLGRGRLRQGNVRRTKTFGAIVWMSENNLLRLPTSYRKKNSFSTPYVYAIDSGKLCVEQL